MSTKPPFDFTRVRPLVYAERPAKVWKHLYDPKEAWGEVTLIDVSALRASTERLIDAKQHRSATRELPTSTPKEALSLLHSHHENGYAQAYLSVLRLDTTQWGKQRSNDRWVALSDTSIFVTVDQRPPAPVVVTAFRPSPLVKSQKLKANVRHGYAQSYFEKKTMANSTLYSALVLKQLQRLKHLPQSASDLWMLTSALGVGRSLAHHAEIIEALRNAEELFAQAAPALTEELRATLDWKSLHDALIASLQADDSEDLENLLFEAETMLAVSWVIGADEEAEAFCAEAEVLIAWIPVEWMHLSSLADSRLESFDDSTSPVYRLWSNVEEACTAALLRELSPVHTPDLAFTHLFLHASPPKWQSWIEKIHSIRGGVGADIASWADAMTEAWSVLAPDPMPTLSANHDEKPPQIQGLLADGAPKHYRLFIVDDEYINGEELTADLQALSPLTIETLWELPPHATAFIILLASAAPIYGDGLANVLDLAALRNDIAIRYKDLTPPS